MKQNLDFTEIKEFCDKVGLNCQIIDEGVIITKPKDIWDGVEFASNGLKIHKIKKIDRVCVYWNTGGFNYIADCKPSTESAYVEQLKKEAFERFGEIKKGDRFKADWINDDIDDYCKTSNPNNWTYIKNSDRFFLAKNGGVPIYCEGKWATRVKERVKVVFFQDSLDEHNKIEEWGYVFKIHNYRYGCEKSIESGQFLAQQLEKYLNGEID